MKENFGDLLKTNKKPDNYPSVLYNALQCFTLAMHNLPDRLQCSSSKIQNFMTFFS